MTAIGYQSHVDALKHVELIQTFKQTLIQDQSFNANQTTQDSEYDERQINQLTKKSKEIQPANLY